MPWYGWYALAISVAACVVTIEDKCRARRGKYRVSEWSLFTVAWLGGALAMLITMRLVRHKTRHRRFMWGLPLILLVHIAIAIFLYGSDGFALTQLVHFFA